MALGRIVGKVANTVENLVLGVATSKPMEKVVGGAAKAVGKAVDPAAGIVNKAIHKSADIGKAAVKKETYTNIGKAVNEKTGKVINNFISDPDSYKQVGRVPFGKSKGEPIMVSNRVLLGDEIHRRVQTGMDSVIHVAKGDSILTGKRPLVTTGGDNLLPMGLKATGLGVAVAGAYEVASGTPQAVQQWNKDRQGTNMDTSPVTSAPRVPAYAQNGGATGDLVFALNNLRNGGFM